METKETLEKAITGLLNERIEGIVAEEAALAAKRVEQRVKEQTASIAASVLRYYSMEIRGDNLTIRVEHKQ
jgi:hypothetical protein